MKYRKIDVSQGSQEWHKIRNTRMTASRIGQLFELKKNEDAFDLYNEMKGIVPPKPVSTFLQHLFQRGHQAEKIGRAWYEEHSKKKFDPAVVVCTDNDFMMASLDGMNEESETLFEHKMISSLDAFEECKAGAIKEEHMLQIQTQMGVCGFKKCIYFVSMDMFDEAKKEFYFDSTFLEIESNPVIYGEIVAKSKKFMDDLGAGIPPEPRIKRKEKKNKKESV